jgi:hypothetical protein
METALDLLGRMVYLVDPRKYVFPDDAYDQVLLMFDSLQIVF